MKCSGHFHKCLLQDPLDAGSTISEPLTFRSVQIDWFVRISRRTKELDETRWIRTFCSGVKFEVIQIKCERAIGCAAYHLTDLLDQRGLAVASEAHDLVFVFIHFEAEICGKCRIQHPQRMRKPDFTKAPDCCRTVCHSLALAD